MRRFLLVLLLLASGSLALAADKKPLSVGQLYWLLDRACASGDGLSVEILLRAGADPSGPKGYENFLKHIGRAEPMMPITQASFGGHTEIVDLLLKAGGNPNIPVGEGVTPLTIASDKGYTEIVRLLLAAGADKNYKSAYGTAEEIAAREGHPEILALLRASNVPPVKFTRQTPLTLVDISVSLEGGKTVFKVDGKPLELKELEAKLSEIGKKFDTDGKVQITVTPAVSFESVSQLLESPVVGNFYDVSVRIVWNFLGAQNPSYQNVNFHPITEFKYIPPLE